MNILERVTLQRIIAYMSDACAFTKDLDFDQFVHDRKTIYACLFCMSQIAKLVAEKDLSNETKKRYKKIEWAKLRNIPDNRRFFGRNLHRLRRCMALYTNNRASYEEGFGGYLDTGSA